jgi:tRNA dimethylallyltransferase
LDIAGPGDELTAGAYSRVARKALFAVRENGRLPIVVGGTGFYVRALVEGLSPAPPRDEELRGRLRKMAQRRPAALYRFLRKHDPEAAERIHPRDQQKLIRAIELTILAGQPASRTQSAPRDAVQGFRVLKLGLAPERSALYAHLNERVVWMFQNGLLSETKALLAAGYRPDSKPMQSIGYKQAVQVLMDGLSVREAIYECQKETRRYAKRQMTWFNCESGVEWLEGFGWEAIIKDRALSIARSWLRVASNPNGLSARD